MPGIYTEKEIYGDALSAQKACTSQFNMAANECTHEDVRQTMMKILNQEHDIQKVFLTTCMQQDFIRHLQQKIKKCRIQNRNSVSV